MQRTINPGIAGTSARSGSPLLYLLVAAVVASLAVAMLCALPHSRYLRFNAVHDSSIEKVGWVFDRVTYDPEPIDVAFFGTSRMVFGVDSEGVEKSYTARTGQTLHAVNFGIQHPGRNMAFLLARETLEKKHVRLFVVEVDEQEARALHPAFYEYAEPADLLSAPLIINPTYLIDLAHLPARQVSLFAKTQFPDLMAVRGTFDQKSYRGHHWDDTFQEAGSPDYPVRNAEPRTHAASPAELARERLLVEQEERDKITLPGPLHALETRGNMKYLDQLLKLARDHGVPVRFLYMPSFGAADQPDFSDQYRERAPIWSNQAVFHNPTWWTDVNHLNWDGARELSAWIGGQLADQNWK